MSAQHLKVDVRARFRRATPLPMHAPYKRPHSSTVVVPTGTLSRYRPRHRSLLRTLCAEACAPHTCAKARRNRAHSPSPTAPLGFERQDRSELSDDFARRELTDAHRLLEHHQKRAADAQRRARAALLKPPAKSTAAAPLNTWSIDQSHQLKKNRESGKVWSFRDFPV